MKARKQGTTYAITGTLRQVAVIAGVKVVSPAPLTGSVLTFWMWDKKTHVTKLSGVAVTIVDPVAGTFSITVAGAYFDTASSYEAEIHEVTSTGILRNYPSSGKEPVEIEEAIS